MTPDEATQIARPWALASLPVSAGEVGLYEFEHGYVAWARVPAGDPDRPPEIVGAPLAVVDKESGELTTWPSLSPQGVAELYELEVTARERFPEDVRTVLTAAGWRSDRSVAAWVESWATGVPLPLFPVARRVLEEFGGLKFRQLKPVGQATGGFDVQFWPTEARVLVDLFAEHAGDIGMPVFPIAIYEDGPSDICVSADGRVFLLHEAGEFLIGATPDEAIVRLVRGEPFTEVDTDGEIVAPS
ncbi:SUKH-3 domain-containing protein [Dactylosporangium sp. NPDC051541]|uniref:SUKH-3 domain-containing protein n=1 Tax=Dactylosporangium sp. NPDC051541 TaxID=3363977 RepID=UPI0037918FF2